LTRRLRTVLVCAALAATVAVPTALGGGAPNLGFQITPSPDFGEVANGSTTTHIFTVQNTGGSASGALVASLSGAGDFSITSDTCTGTSIGPKKTCQVGITYAPRTDGANDTATLTVAGKKSAAVATLIVTGTTPGGKSCTPDAAHDLFCLVIAVDGLGEGGDPAAGTLAVDATFAIDLNTMTATGGGTYTQRDGTGTVIGQGTLEPPYSLLGPVFFLNGNPANCQDADAFLVGISAMSGSSAQVALSISLLSSSFTADISDAAGDTQYSGAAAGITGSC
jgi:hypothetical protein